MTNPISDIVDGSLRTVQIRDRLGRGLTVRRLNALDRLRLLKAAGPELSQNTAWLNVAALGIAAIEINGVPRMTPMNERQIEANVSELGDSGLDAVSEALTELADSSSLLSGPPEGNVVGTPI